MRTSVRITNAIQWRIDPDGFLRITMRVLKHGIYSYSANDIPKEVTETKPNLSTWNVLIPKSTFTDDFIKTGEGKPIIADEHDWQDVETVSPDRIKGSVAGAGRVDGDSIIFDAVITDKDTIEKIQSGSLVEVSAGYHSGIEAVSNVEGADAKQTGIAFNHFVLLPVGRGRCGSDVRILNSKDTNMVIVKIKNSSDESGKEYQFTNEEDAKMAQNMADEAEASKVAEMEAKNHELEDAKQKFASMEAAMGVLQGTLAELKSKIESYESEEYAASVAEERAEYGKKEEMVMNELLSDEEKSAVVAKIANCKTMNERLMEVAGSVGTKFGFPVSKDVGKTVFETLVGLAKAKVLNSASLSAPKPETKVQNSNAVVGVGTFY